jgi:hypothetical protein
VGSFLLALFEKTAETVGGMGGNISTRIIEFRDFMSRKQKMGSAGAERVNFYLGVVQRAQEVRLDFVPFNFFLLIVFKVARIQSSR